MILTYFLLLKLHYHTYNDGNTIAKINKLKFELLPIHLNCQIKHSATTLCLMASKNALVDNDLREMEELSILAILRSSTVSYYTDSLTKLELWYVNILSFLVIILRNKTETLKKKKNVVFIVRPSGLISRHPRIPLCLSSIMSHMTPLSKYSIVLHSIPSLRYSCCSDFSIKSRNNFCSFSLQ